jgi:required for meiotic nuclear division protein 1
MADPAELDALGTIITPVKVETSRLELRAVYFKSPIRLDVPWKRFSSSQILSADPVVLRLMGDGFVVVLRFGTVVFWACDATTGSEVIAEIQQFAGTGPPVSEAGDTLLVLTGQREEQVTFREIRLEDLSLEHIKIISETFGRSVALRQCELSLSQALKNTSPMVQALEARGALVSSARKIVKTVGFTLAVWDAILARLSLFDDPAETWRSERLSRLHDRLVEHFDIKKRLLGVEKKVTFLSDLNMMLLTLLQNRTSHRLELIVILLIVIEVIFSFIHSFSP